MGPRVGDGYTNGLYHVPLESQTTGKREAAEGDTMAEQEGTADRGMSRRKFLTLAGAGAVFGALVIAATRQKGVQGLLKATSATRAPNQATAGKTIQTSTQTAGPTFLQKLLGGKL